ncbi:hypothetical protein DICSQDRAFT_103411 [Dichomitus squalens LYAD-421 SS1]|uniref:uncharacterized protein n=1 Tax=Dichomitus squalens (strain LYAD-421) TaxID=732165 RepID=UPI00044152ED|nr:uncharacterized protein DICSQDRAFT_103411 [Dichomitus squalens LYAD-421 SS1]EJF62980.1 hypothetical protein DICSQDRAFT_103411 [Dichomitus squalens LYAD-421 SS1]
MNRGRRKEEIERAYQIQVAAGLRGAAQFGAVGLGTAAIAHHYWPTFRRQTLPFKAWLVSIVAVFGLCIHAENALQAHELEQRLKENKIRREARVDLARRGLVATETEIAKWKEQRERALDAAAAQAKQDATTAQASASEQ